MAKTKIASYDPKETPFDGLDDAIVEGKLAASKGDQLVLRRNRTAEGHVYTVFQLFNTVGDIVYLWDDGEKFSFSLEHDTNLPLKKLSSKKRSAALVQKRDDVVSGSEESVQQINGSEDNATLQ